MQTSWVKHKLGWGNPNNANGFQSPAQLFPVASLAPMGPAGGGSPQGRLMEGFLLLQPPLPLPLPSFLELCPAHRGGLGHPASLVLGSPVTQCTSMMDGDGSQHHQNRVNFPRPLIILIKCPEAAQGFTKASKETSHSPCLPDTDPTK